MRRRQQLGRSFSAIREVISRPALRRLQLAGLAGEIGGWAYWIVLSLYAYANGGAVAVGVVGGLRLGGSAIAAPFAGVVADRFPRRQVLFWTDVTRAACLAAAAIADSLDGPRAVVLGMAVLFAIAGTAFRPALSALLPMLCETAEDLTAVERDGDRAREREPLPRARDRRPRRRSRGHRRGVLVRVRRAGGLGDADLPDPRDGEALPARTRAPRPSSPPRSTG